MVNVRLTAATGPAEREAAVSMVEAIPGRHRITVGADKAYCTKDFVANMCELSAALRDMIAVASGSRCTSDRGASSCRPTATPATLPVRTLNGYRIYSNKAVMIA